MLIKKISYIIILMDFLEILLFFFLDKIYIF